MRTRLLWLALGLPLLVLVVAKLVDLGIGAIGIRSPRTVLVEGVKRHIVLREHQPLSRLRFKETHTGVGRYIELSVDENGFIEPSRVHEKAAVEIVFLGGSTVECLMNDPESRFPRVVGRLLEKSGVVANCYNGGVSGNTTMHALNILLNKVVPMAPDYVILMENINDVGTLIHERSYWNVNPTRRMVATSVPNSRREFGVAFKNAVRRFYPRLSEMVYVVRQKYGDPAIIDEWRLARGRDPSVDRAGARSQYRNSLMSFISLSRANSITPILMTQPRRRHGKVSGGQQSALDAARDMLFEEFNEIMREIARTEKVGLIDLYVLVPWEKQLFYDSIHYTDEGSQRVAWEIHAALTGMLAPDGALGWNESLH